MEFEQRFKASGTGYCTVEDGIIYEFNPLLNGSKNRVGVTDAVYNELKAISDEYYKKLVELGAITPPTKPQVTGVGAVCPNAGIINGLGIGSGINGCGTGITGIA